VGKGDSGGGLRASMTGDDAQRAKEGPSLGLGLMALGATMFCLAFGIEEVRIGGHEGPGPRAFPMALSLLLFLGGVIQFGMWARASRKLARASEAAAMTGGEEAVSRRRAWDAALVMIAVAAHIPAMSWLGFSLSTLLFSVFMVTRLGGRWLTALIGGLSLVIVAQGLFVWLFRVQLPMGKLGLPF
jgi:hypothetical protein